jgi:lipopolysaccharide/colanic/teichoic acid biosynthesis glycosyltransferase
VHLQNAELRPVRRTHLSFDSPSTAPSIRPEYRWYVPLKAAVDWLAALLLAVPAGVMILLLAALVRLTSPGRAFYSQRRVGLNGRVFTMYKLRTMVENCELTTGPVWCTRDDPRVTGIGRILRDTHLDELPQIWNVLRGEMSLIGPRPERPEIVARLERTIPNYLDRIAVRPGLTGLAQVQLPADSDDDSVRRKLACDRYYASLLSPWLDLRIALCTCLYLFSAVLKALCHSLVSSCKREIERRFGDSALFEERPAAQNIG